MSEKPEGRTIWNTPAGATPSVLAQLDLSRKLTPEEIEQVRRETEEKLAKDPLYQAFKRGAEEARYYRDPTVYWNGTWRSGR